MEEPVLNPNPDWSELITTCEAVRKEIASGKSHEDGDLDDQNYIYAAAMKALYGPHFFRWRDANR